MRPEKLAQRQMLGIVNPGLVSVDKIKNKSTRQVCDCDHYGHFHAKGDCPAYGKEYHKCGGKNHVSKKCRQKSSRFSKGSSKFESKCDSRRPSRANGNGKCSHKCRVHEKNECQDDMENLTEQVQFIILLIETFERQWLVMDSQMSQMLSSICC